MLTDWQQGHYDTRRGFCLYLMCRRHAVGYVHLNWLDELNSLKPKTMYRDENGSTAYWWSPDRKAKRIEALKKAVAMASRVEKKGKRS